MNAFHHFPPALAEIFRSVLQASWQGALAIVLVLLVRWTLGTRVPARWHYLLWFLVLARLLVPTGALPRSPASLENLPSVAHPFTLPPGGSPGAATTRPPDFVSTVNSLPAPSNAAGATPHLAARLAVLRPAGSWWLWAAWVWLGGALLHAAWLAACVLGLRRRLRRETFPIEAETLAIWHACCRRWLGRTPPGLLAADWVDSPALVGCWRPRLLIPRHALHTFSTRDWEHVFAHEIAHLRWRDHWTQAPLLAAWCVHWFNPLVWLGLRRLRADRELAADEWVLRHLGGDRSLGYGETLFKTLANRPAHPSFQPGMVGISEDGAQMKQRLRRIAAFLPQRRLLGSLAGLAAVLGLATVVLGQGSSEPPSPSKPVAAPTPQSHGSNSDAPKAPSPAPHQDFLNSGRVSMADGTPLGSEPINAYTHYEGSGNWGGAEVVRDGLFYLNVPSDTPEDTTTLTVAVEQRGCAVTFAGPTTLANLNKLGSLEVKLTRGHSASVQIVDEAGKPIPGALLRPYHPGPPLVELAETRTDAAGKAVIEHLGDAPLNLRVLADGFEADEVTALHLDPAQPYRLTLKAAQPLRGTVVAAASGQPIPGAVIKLGGVRGPHDEDHYDPKKAPLLTSTDGLGHFALASLRPDSRYYLFVEAPGYGGTFLRGVTLARGELKVALGSELLIRGKIIHAPPSVIHLGNVYLQYGQGFAIGDYFEGQRTETLSLHPVNGEADFTVGPFYKVDGEPVDAKNTLALAGKSVELYVDSWGTARFRIDELPVADFVFDLARKTNDRSPPEPEAAARPADAEGNAAPSPTPAPRTVSPAPVVTLGPTPAPAAAATARVVNAQGRPVAGASIRP